MSKMSYNDPCFCLYHTLLSYIPAFNPNTNLIGLKKKFFLFYFFLYIYKDQTNIPTRVTGTH